MAANPNLRETLEELRARFNPAAIQKSATCHLSLGDDEAERWTVMLTPTSCEVVPGRVGDPDCVVKMPADLFIQLVSGTYQPGPIDFVTGKIKTDAIGPLIRLQKAFGFAP